MKGVSKNRRAVFEFYLGQGFQAKRFEHLELSQNDLYEMIESLKRDPNKTIGTLEDLLTRMNYATPVEKGAFVVGETRIELTGNYSNRFGFEYVKGQKGLVISNFGENYVIEFDGYEEQRASVKEYEEKYGESPITQVVYTSEIPKELLNIIE